MPEKPVSFFGRLALKKNYVTPEQLHECVSIQLAAEEQGAAPPRLGEVLVRKGYMTEEQVREVLALQKKAPSTATAAAPEKMVATFEPGAVVFREGDEDHRDLYILLEGVVREEKNGILLHEFATQGAFLGPIATLLKVPRATTVVAKSAVKVFRVPEENVEIFFRNRPAMAIRLGEVLAERLHNIMRQHVESAADAARGLPAGSTPDAASGEAAVAGLGGMAQLAEDGKGRLVLRDIQVPDAAYVNGYAATDETVLRDQDNVQIGQYMLQVFYDHPGLIRPEPEASPGGEAPEEPVPAAAASTAGAGDEAVPPPPLAEAAPPPSADSGSEPLADEALAAAVDAARSEPFPEAVRQAVGLQIGFHLQAEALDGRRVALLDGLAEDAPEREDVKREVERQRREIEKPPPASSLEQSIGKLEAQLAPPAPAEAADGDAPDDEDAEAPQNGPPPLSDGMRAAYGIALEQKRLFLERERNLPKVLQACAASVADEPLFRILAGRKIDPQALFGWAVYRAGLEELAEAHGRKLSESKAKRDALQPKKKGLLGLVKREDDEAREAQLAGIEEEEAHSRSVQRAAQREGRNTEREAVNEFWRVYEAAALALLAGLAPADAPFVRAFLRRALLCISPRFVGPAHAKAILIECNAGCVEPQYTLDATHVFYADEAIELSARGQIPASPNEDLELNHRNSPMWKADRALRKIVNCRIQEQLLRQTLERLEQDAVDERKNQAEAEKRLKLLNPNDRKRKEKLSELRHEVQRHKVEAGRKERLTERVRTALLPRLVEEGELARNSLNQSGMMLKPEDLVRHEVACMRRFSRLVAKLKEPFLPFSLRDQYKPEQGGVNDRAAVVEALADAEQRDPLLFQEPLVPVNRKQHRVLVRYAPVVALTPCPGIMGFMMVPRGGIENGRIVLPGCFGRGDERQAALWEVLSDFRYDTSKASAGVDIMNSETLVAAYAEVRWNLRKKDRDVRQKAAIYTEENERTNWRRHYALYMKSAQDSGKLLFFKCPDLYEMIVPKYIELPDGCEVLKRG